jgi:hypothetical protein
MTPERDVRMAFRNVAISAMVNAIGQQITASSGTIGRRFTRLTNTFSKKFENHTHMAA